MQEQDDGVLYEVVYRDVRACQRLYARCRTYEEAKVFADRCEADPRRDPRFAVRIRREGEE